MQNAPKGSILQYFQPSLSYHLSLLVKIFVLSVFEWRLKTVFTVLKNKIVKNQPHIKNKHAKLPIIQRVKVYFIVQYSPFITLCLRSIRLDCVISEPCYIGTILQKNYRKITIYGHFPMTPL